MVREDFDAESMFQVATVVMVFSLVSLSLISRSFQDQLPIGTGCVYPANVKTLADQLKMNYPTWKGYMGDRGTTLHVNLRFMYFHSIIDSPD